MWKSYSFVTCFIILLDYLFSHSTVGYSFKLNRQEPEVYCDKDIDNENIHSIQIHHSNNITTKDSTSENTAACRCTLTYTSPGQGQRTIEVSHGNDGSHIWNVTDSYNVTSFTLELGRSNQNKVTSSTFGTNGYKLPLLIVTKPASSQLHLRCNHSSAGILPLDTSTGAPTLQRNFPKGAIETNTIILVAIISAIVGLFLLGIIILVLLIYRRKQRRKNKGMETMYENSEVDDAIHAYGNMPVNNKNAREHKLCEKEMQIQNMPNSNEHELSENKSKKFDTKNGYQLDYTKYFIQKAPKEKTNNSTDTSLTVFPPVDDKGSENPSFVNDMNVPEASLSYKYNVDVHTVDQNSNIQKGTAKTIHIPSFYEGENYLSRPTLTVNNISHNQRSHHSKDTQHKVSNKMNNNPQKSQTLDYNDNITDQRQRVNNVQNSIYNTEIVDNNDLERHHIYKVHKNPTNIDHTKQMMDYLNKKTNNISSKGTPSILENHSNSTFMNNMSNMVPPRMDNQGIKPTHILDNKSSGETHYYETPLVPPRSLRRPSTVCTLDQISQNTHLKNNANNENSMPHYANLSSVNRPKVMTLFEDTGAQYADINVKSKRPHSFNKPPKMRHLSDHERGSRPNSLLQEYPTDNTIHKQIVYKGNDTAKSKQQPVYKTNKLSPEDVAELYAVPMKVKKKRKGSDSQPNIEHLAYYKSEDRTIVPSERPTYSELI